MLKFVKQLTDFQYQRVSFAKCTQLERSPGIRSIACQQTYERTRTCILWPAAIKAALRVKAGYMKLIRFVCTPLRCRAILCN